MQQKLSLLGFRKVQQMDFYCSIYSLMTMLSNCADDSNLFNIGKDINKVKNALAEISEQ